MTLDLIERSIGRYEMNRRRALARSLNPLFYVWLIFDWIAQIPFAFVGMLGFDREKAESSTIGRVFKSGYCLVVALASLLTILHLLDYLTPVRELVNRALESN